MNHLTKTAYSIDNNKITYLCEHCSKYYTKKGQPRVYPQLVFHRHGSRGDTSNRTEQRCSHCPHETYKEIKIEITDETWKFRNIISNSL